ncbi:DUF2087 domain-containing protein [Sporosarcina sp. A2]|uniref:DUF2087 domain-containing protein n=1 Tax=Sporosarcina sp. A2 TaxID=3393449 RepID=UPI003D796AE5
MENLELLWNASLTEMKNGYIEDQHSYTCLLCGEQIDKGIVYPDGNTLYEAERYMRLHIENEHKSVFDYLIGMEKRLTGLTDHQNQLLRLFYEGKSDKEVQHELEIGSVSTVRHHRFALKEKERQAKLFLTMMELMKEKGNHTPAFIAPHKTAKMVDDRYAVTETEQQEILEKFLPEGVSEGLTKFPPKEKQRLVVLRGIVNLIDGQTTYSEKELNELLNRVHDDYVLIRRYLIDYGFLDRTADGSEYWLKN